MRGLAFFCAVLAASDAVALDLPGNARLTAERISQKDRYDAPVAVFDGQKIPVQAMEGQIRRQAWLVPGAGLTPLQIIAPAREQLEADGFTTILDCDAAQCGGFDFRFGTEVLPAPAMFVNLRNYQFLTMAKGSPEDPVAITTLMVSTTRDAGYVQIVEVFKDGEFRGERPSDGLAPNVARPVAGDVTLRDAGDLLNQGFVVLDGVDFSSGETQLGDAPIPALEQLAKIMTDNPDLRIALVGHTDSVGSLDGNIRISRQRARAVRSKLINDYGLAPTRLEAEGMGYLAPRASNLTEAGRDANRRVEAIVLSNQ